MGEVDSRRGGDIREVNIGRRRGSPEKSVHQKDSRYRQNNPQSHHALPS
jgi:hypothetical protein